MTAALLQQYRPHDGVADELFQLDGAIRPVWQPLIDFLARQPSGGIEARFLRGDQYLHDAGVYFRQHTDAGSSERDWPLSHIPVLVDGAEWAALSEGIIQRAELLERVMADLYGPARLIADNILPAELVARNPEWLRPMVGAVPKSGHFLHFIAFEIGRSPDGSWFVLGDRTQAPSGAGFALENRVATARVFSDYYPFANIERLAGFFRGFRDALNGLRKDGRGRVAVLTPGPETDTYFEHSYIARYLGSMLLESEDLKVENNQLMVRTIHGPEPVGVLWRRLDARDADPLELDENSALGTPGMVRALRNGGLTMVNSLGSGVLEARAMLAFMPRICDYFFNTPLKLPNIATWWCAQAAQRDYVRANIERMMVGPALTARLPFDAEATTMLGGAFRGTARPSVEEWIEADGADLVAQEAVTLSTTPAMVGGKLAPRPMTVRVFAARTPDGWTIMPGGYARIGGSDDPTALAMRDGGSVADVWVVANQPIVQDSLSSAATGDQPFVRRLPGTLPSRAADNLFWLGRYLERVEVTVRELRAYHQRLAESHDPDQPLLKHLRAYLKSYGTDVSRPIPDNLLNDLDQARTCASKVRDQFSTDGWLAISDLAKTARQMRATATAGEDAAAAMGVLIRKLVGFSGLVHENMFRFTGWRFLSIGRALERAERMAGFLATFADVGAPIGGFDLAVEVGDSIMAHRRRYSVETNRNTVVDLLALDANNPRSLLFQFQTLKTQETHLSGSQPGQLNDLSRLVLKLQTELRVTTPEALTSARLTDMRADIAQISDTLISRHMG